MPGRRPAVTLLIRLAALAVALVGLGWVFTADRAAEVRFALGILGFVLAFVALAVTALMLSPWFREGGLASAGLRKPGVGDVALCVGVALLVATGLPRVGHVATRIHFQTVVACRMGIGQRWSAAVHLSGGELVSLNYVLDPAEGCLQAGTTFEKRRWEDAYLIGGKPRWEKRSFQLVTRGAALLGLVLLGVGVGARTRIWRSS